MKLNTLEKLLVQELKDIHSAETQLVEALPKMAAASHHPELRQAFQSHLQETKTHVARIESIFKEFTFQPGGHRCVAMEALIEEGAEMIKADAVEEVRDAGLIAAAQRVEHYEIAAYGTAAALADKLGMPAIAATLRETLAEESEADKLLTRLAESLINPDALDA